MEVREWYFIDSSTNLQRGPVPLKVVENMIQKNIGITPDTLVWKAGLEGGWQKISDVPPFKAIFDFLNIQWFYLESDGQQKGPSTTR